MLGTGMMVGLAYATEFFIAWYSGNLFESFAFINRAFGPFWWAYFLMVSCNVLVPQAFWSKKVRRSPIIIFVLCILINVGMWFERFVIIATSLARSFLPAQWSYYSPTRYDVGLFVGTALKSATSPAAITWTWVVSSQHLPAVLFTFGNDGHVLELVMLQVGEDPDVD